MTERKILEFMIVCKKSGKSLRMGLHKPSVDRRSVELPPCPFFSPEREFKELEKGDPSVLVAPVRPGEGITASGVREEGGGLRITVICKSCGFRDSELVE